MAKQKKLSGGYKLCAPGDKSCKGAPLPSVSFKMDSEFSYTTLTARPPRSAADRRKHGCAEPSPGKFTGLLKDGTPDNYCGVTSPPCGTLKEARSSCPVQLTFVDGKPNLRFCIKPGTPGYLVPVKSPEHAEEIARRACADWPNKMAKVWPDEFFKKKAPFIVEEAERSYPKSPWGVPGLGETLQRTNPAWLAAGIAMGVMAAILIKKRQAVPAAQQPAVAA